MKYRENRVMKDFYCRICGKLNDKSKYFVIMESILPLAASVTDNVSRDIDRYPLSVVRGGYCGHVQLRESLDSNFYDDYLYTPSYANGFKKLHTNFCKQSK